MKKMYVYSLISTIIFIISLASNSHSDETEQLISSKYQDEYLLSMCVNTGNAHLAFSVDLDNMYLEVGHLTENNKIIGINLISATGEKNVSFGEFSWFMPSKNHAIPNLSSDSKFVKKLGFTLPNTAVNSEDTDTQTEEIKLINISVTDLFKAAAGVENDDKNDTETSASAVVNIKAEKLLTTLFTGISDVDAKTILSNSSKNMLQCSLEAVELFDDRSRRTGIKDKNRFQIKIKKSIPDTELWIDSGTHIIVAANGFGPRSLKNVHGWAYSEDASSSNKKYYYGNTSLHPRDSGEPSLKSDAFNFDKNCGAALYSINLVIGMHQRFASYDTHRFTAGNFIDYNDTANKSNSIIAFCNMKEEIDELNNDGHHLEIRRYITTWDDKGRYDINDERLKQLFKVVKENPFLIKLSETLFKQRVQVQCPIS